MSDYKSPVNPTLVKHAKVRWFDGIGGPSDQVLSRRNEKGWDISDTICNDVQDLNLSEKGTMILRAGMVRLSSAMTSSVAAIFPMRMGGTIRYGVVAGGSLDISTPPRSGGLS